MGEMCKNVDKQFDRLKQMEDMLDRIGEGEEMSAELEAMMGDDLDGLLDQIIASNAEALEECEEMDKYLDKVKNSLEE